MVDKDKIKKVLELVLDQFEKELNKHLEPKEIEFKVNKSGFIKRVLGRLGL